MLTWDENVEINVLRKQGWSIRGSHANTGRDRRTIRTYLKAFTAPGVRKQTDRICLSRR